MAGDRRKNTWLWDITENGKSIILIDGEVSPPFDESVTDLQLLIELKINQLTLTYPMTLKKASHLKEKSNSSSTGHNKKAEINYIRLKYN